MTWDSLKLLNVEFAKGDGEWKVRYFTKALASNNLVSVLANNSLNPKGFEVGSFANRHHNNYGNLTLQ